MNQYFIDKLSLFLTEVSFDTSEGSQLSYFQNCYLKKNLMIHGKMLVKKINIIPELFIIKNSEFNFVSFSSSYSLCIKLKIPTNLVEIKSVQTFI